MYYVETIFDVAYLLLVVTLGIIMLVNAKGNGKYSLFGAMAVILGSGDAFHLIPRIYSMWSPGGFEANTAALGIGKLVTSVTMTAFYMLLYYVWRKRYGIKKHSGLTFAMIALAAVRIALCLFPQNGWTLASAPLSWAIYRNIPFAIIGILMIVLFYTGKQRLQTIRLSGICGWQSRSALPSTFLLCCLPICSRRWAH